MNTLPITSNKNNHYEHGFKVAPYVGRIVASVALAAITAVAAYYMLNYGFARLDCAFTRMDLFVGGVMAYMGTVYAIAAFANCVVTCSHALSMNDESGDEKMSDLLVMQTGLSLFAPLAAVPAACFAGLQTALNR